MTAGRLPDSLDVLEGFHWKGQGLSIPPDTPCAERRETVISEAWEPLFHRFQVLPLPFSPTYSDDLLFV